MTHRQSRMDKKPPRRHRQMNWQFPALALATALVLVSPTIVGQGQAPPLDQAREMALKITAPFTLAAVGDLDMMHTGVSQLADPAAQGAFKIIRDADVAFGNMHSSIADLHHFNGPMYGLMGPKTVAADLKAMGFDLLNRAHNLATSSGIEGMFSTDNILDEVGIVHAGSGRNLEEARAVAYVATTKGRVGLVGMFATVGGGGGFSELATSRFGYLGGAAGVNPLRLTRTNIVTADQLEALRKIRNAVYETRSSVTHPVPPLPASEPTDRLELFGSTYRVGAATGGYSYTMNASDLRGNLRSIRNGKQTADFMIATVRNLDGPSAVELTNLAESPADFLIELAHQTIDNGADAFIGHGVHVLRGVEIYKGKPIFYGLHGFVYQLGQERAGLERYQGENPFLTESTDVELEWQYYASYARPRISQDNLESVVAESRYAGGRLVEVRLHPLDLGINAPISQKGIPRIASPEVALRILQRMQTLSKPFGTTITIEDNVGVIRVPPSATTVQR